MKFIQSVLIVWPETTEEVVKFAVSGYNEATLRSAMVVKLYSQ